MNQNQQEIIVCNRHTMKRLFVCEVRRAEPELFDGRYGKLTVFTNKRTLKALHKVLAENQLDTMHEGEQATISNCMMVIKNKTQTSKYQYVFDYVYLANGKIKLFDENNNLALCYVDENGKHMPEWNL